ncbi:hypothetical protein Btru_026163 [Bulinus truncatus]|nr:hypothetical protein Btru_026163 [Bulinus truncatus]
MGLNSVGKKAKKTYFTTYSKLLSATRKLCNGDTSGINTQLKWNVTRMDWISILAFVATVTSFTNQFVGIEICFHIVRRRATLVIFPLYHSLHFCKCCHLVQVWIDDENNKRNPDKWSRHITPVSLHLLLLCILYKKAVQRIPLFRQSYPDHELTNRVKGDNCYHQVTHLEQAPCENVILQTQFYGFFIIGTIILFIPLLYVTFYEEEIDVATQNIGLYCAGVGILCYASPLATLSKVIKQKSTSSISFPLCFVNFLCAVEWSLYGAAIEDYVLLIPNFLGIFLGLAQFYLFWIYGCKINKLAWMTETK